MSFCHPTSLGRTELAGSQAEFAAMLQKAFLTVLDKSKTKETQVCFKTDSESSIFV